MILSLIIIAVCSGLIGLGVRALFPKRGKWLPVVVGGVVPPFLIFPIGLYRVLVGIGLRAEQTGETNGVIDQNAPAIDRLLQVSGLWIFVGIPTVLLVLFVLGRYQARP